MKKDAAEPYRDIDFSRAKRGPVIKAESGKTKISIRLDNRVIDHFRSVVDRAGGGNYQTLINDALLAYIQQRSMLEAVRQVVREEIAAPGRGLTSASTRTRGKRSSPLAG
ncbi:MAG: BrnA antitoxin family protein [Chromatiales bacterium]